MEILLVTVVVILRSQFEHHSESTDWASIVM